MAMLSLFLLSLSGASATVGFCNDKEPSCAAWARPRSKAASTSRDLSGNQDFARAREVAISVGRVALTPQPRRGLSKDA